MHCNKKNVKIKHINTNLFKDLQKQPPRGGSVKNLLLEILQKREAFGFRSATLLKERLWQRCFLVNFAKFLRTHFLTEHLWWLLLDLSGDTLAWNISLIFTIYNSHKKLSFKIPKLTKNLFRLDIFAIYFPLKLIVLSSIFFRLELFFFINRKLFLLFCFYSGTSNNGHLCTMATSWFAVSKNRPCQI